ncbi:MAG: hypothetical protein R3337_14535 [Gammaproteobacteria bacterium]|nr:hypothetical protein [Gammaproteobacteria bacterium]
MDTEAERLYALFDHIGEGSIARVGAPFDGQAFTATPGKFLFRVAEDPAGTIATFVDVATSVSFEVVLPTPVNGTLLFSRNGEVEYREDRVRMRILGADVEHRLLHGELLDGDNAGATVTIEV